MRKSLQKIAALVDGLIAGDPFPEGIRPDYLQKAVRDYPARGGKRLRPALVVWCGTLFAPEAEERLWRPAAAVEIFHNWTLVHDDIIDRDDFRRREPTCHVRLAEDLRPFALPETERKHMASGFAMLAGDLQHAWATDLLLRSAEMGIRSEVALAMARNMAYLGSHELISGEALDMELSLRPVETILPEEAGGMIDLKTGALLKLAAQTGAMAALQTADVRRPEVEAVGQFALHCGRAFQMQDDLLGIFGSAPKLGKPIGNDLREAKRTPLLLTALQKLSPAGRRELTGLLHRPDYTEEDLNRARELMTGCGAKDAVERRIAQLTDACARELESLPDGDSRRILLEFAAYLAKRNS